MIPFRWRLRTGETNLVDGIKCLPCKGDENVLFWVGGYTTVTTYQTEQLTVHVTVCEMCLLNVFSKKNTAGLNKHY